jgi:hypothetical protein
MQFNAMIQTRESSSLDLLFTEQACELISASDLLCKLSRVFIRAQEWEKTAELKHSEQQFLTICSMMAYHLNVRGTRI